MAVLLIAFFAAGGSAQAGATYRDYDERFVPKSPERRRVVVSIGVERDSVERGASETKLLQGLAFAHFSQRPGIEFVPHVFYNPDRLFLAQARSLEADDAIQVTLSRLKVPPATAETRGKRSERRYDLGGTVRIVNVMTGNTVAEGELDKVVMPDIGSYTDEVEGSVASLLALVSFMSTFYDGNAPVVKASPTCAALDAAKAAEAAQRYDEAALILSDAVRKDPTKEAELRDRRDLAMMRAGRGVPPPSASGGGSEEGTSGAPRQGVDFLDPANKGKLFPVSQGHIKVRDIARDAGFAFSVGVLAKDPRARGGILVSSKTKNMYFSVTPGEGGRPEMMLEIQNIVTGTGDTRKWTLPPDAFVVDRLSRLAVRYDGGNLEASINGLAVATIPRVPLPQAGIFLFGKLSTIYFQDAALSQ